MDRHLSITYPSHSGLEVSIAGAFSLFLHVMFIAKATLSFPVIRGEPYLIVTSPQVSAPLISRPVGSYK